MKGDWFCTKCCNYYPATFEDFAETKREYGRYYCPPCREIIDNENIKIGLTKSFLEENKELESSRDATFTNQEIDFENAIMVVGGVPIGTQKQWEHLTQPQKTEIEQLIAKFFEENTIRNCKAKKALLANDKLAQKDCAICKEKKTTILVHSGEWGEYSLDICLDCLQYEGEE